MTSLWRRASGRTGERLDHEDELYAADLVRHRVAYLYAAARADGLRVLDLGCGTGYGTRELTEGGSWVIGLDGASPKPSARRSSARFVRADLGALPLAPCSFDLVVSFQVIEHLVDPAPYLAGIARVLRPGGTAVLSTPNVLQSDGENPYHVREYGAADLETRLRAHFEDVELLGVGAVGEAARYHEARLRQIRRITRLDPLGLRRALPRALVEWLFARLSVVVRLGIARSHAAPRLSADDFPIGPPDEGCLDLLAVCRRPCVADPVFRAASAAPARQ